jgi:hypothetical protein
VLAGEAALEGFGEGVDLLVFAPEEDVVAAEEFELEGEVGEVGGIGAEDGSQEGGVGVGNVSAVFLVGFVAFGGDAGKVLDLFRGEAEGAAAMAEEEVLHWGTFCLTKLALTKIDTRSFTGVVAFDHTQVLR